MAHLSIRLLGHFEVGLDGDPITAFESDKVRALLAYLAVEAAGPQRRERLAGLLWPDWPEGAARTNLRRALANLRLAIGDRQAEPPFLHITRQAIQFNHASDAWVDVTAFLQLLEAEAAATEPAPRSDQQTIQRLGEAVALYRGGFLEGFSLPDSTVFEEWALLNRERLHRLMMEALYRLADCHAGLGQVELALQYAWQQVELDPWREDAQRLLMRLLALNGQRGAALAQYEAYRRLLADELDVEPGAETAWLYEQIRDEELGDVPPARRLPPFVLQEGAIEVERPVFVAREPELARLDAFLDAALAGQGQVVFVTGGPGRGKTVLMDEFARRSMGIHRDLLVAMGSCNAYSGVGDPYLPFRKVLDLLSGDVEAHWEAGTLSGEHARRLWHALPFAARALVEAGPDLIDTFLPGSALDERAAAFARAAALGEPAWLARLGELVGRKAALPPDPHLQQSALFRQVTRMLGALARQRPLLLILDDLQWIDVGSVGLLFHLGRELAGLRILIVAAYRPNEVALGREGDRHPLDDALNEFKRRFGDVWLDLSQADETGGRHFVDAFLDSEPNRLDEAFRDHLFRRTQGHPLFTIELLRAMQERGDLIQDPEAGGAWVAGPALAWDALPAKVEGAIEERIGRLEPELRDILTVASVEGEEFTAQVVARVQNAGEREVMGHLTGPLERQHRLVRSQGVRRLDGRQLSLHRFRHNLFQTYLYQDLNEAERAYLHADVGHALEALYADHPDALAGIAPQLARQFQEAGVTDKAIEYLYQAGQGAARVMASAEAVGHFSRALELLAGLPDTPERARTELRLQVSLAVPLLATRGWSAPELGRLVARTQALCEQLGEPPHLFQALWFANTYHLSRAHFQTARSISEQLLAMGQRQEDPAMRMSAHTLISVPLYHLGEFHASLTHAESGLALYDPEQHRNLAFRFSQDPKARCLGCASWVLWTLGYPDRARQYSAEAVTHVRELSHPFSLAFALFVDTGVQLFCRDWQAAQELATECLGLSTEHGWAQFWAWSTWAHGLTLAQQGQTQEGIPQMRQGLSACESIGSAFGRSIFLSYLVKGYRQAGQTEESLAVLAEAEAFEERTGECWFESELQRLKGELLLDQGRDAAKAEQLFDTAIQVARSQSARSLELRATMSLCRLWQAQGKREQARQALEPIYGWFTEGFDTADLQEAKALLQTLSQPKGS